MFTPFGFCWLRVHRKSTSLRVLDLGSAVELSGVDDGEDVHRRPNVAVILDLLVATAIELRPHQIGKTNHETSRNRPRSVRNRCVQVCGLCAAYLGIG